MEEKQWFTTEETGVLFQKDQKSISRACQRGEFGSAKKVGDRWFIHRSDVCPTKEEAKQNA